MKQSFRSPDCQNFKTLCRSPIGEQSEDRGMSAWHDWVDWVGGLPFEVATPDKIESMLAERGFKLERSKGSAKAGAATSSCFGLVHERSIGRPVGSP